jgi:dipeptidyl aminopeptidase/acylaminoacyl peptidase
MCSKGYVVMVPDIEVQAGNSGNSIMDCINGAYNYLQSVSWADRIGLNGHSFAGYETQYIITRTGVFAAAIASSGMSDLVSLTGELTLEEGIPYQREWAEIGQGKLGKTLWEDPSLYLQNSPLLHADKITTPLLMMNNKLDGVVNFSQGVEMFTALRRLRKRVWMLQYDNEYHSLYSPAMKDYTIRVLQFYDHFLKGAPMPAWMQYGVPAERKGMEDVKDSSFTSW